MRRGKAVVEDGRVGVIAIHFFFFFFGHENETKKKLNREGHRPPGVISRLADEVLVEMIESVKRGLVLKEERRRKGTKVER